MLDWDGNGKIDPVDTGISIAVEESNDNQEKYKRTSGGGCFTVCLVFFLFMLCIAILIF